MLAPGNGFVLIKRFVTDGRTDGCRLKKGIENEILPDGVRSVGIHWPGLGQGLVC